MPTRWGGTLDNEAKSRSDSPLKQAHDGESAAVTERRNYNITDNPNHWTVSYIKQFSPRSHEAMRREGVVPREIAAKSLQWFESRLPESTVKDIAQIRFNHSQNKRKTMIRDLKKARQNIIATNWKPMPSLKAIKKNRSLAHSTSASQLQTPKLSRKTSPRKSGKSRKSSVRGSPKRGLHRNSTASSLLQSPAKSASFANNPEFSVLANDERFTAEVTKEQRHFEAIAQRQKVDLEKMIAYEIKMMLHRNEQDHKMHHQEQYQEKLRKNYNAKMEKIRLKKHREEQRKRFLEEERERKERMAANKTFQDLIANKRRKEHQALLRRKEEEEQLHRQQQKQMEFHQALSEKQQRIRQKRRDKMQRMILEDQRRNQKLAARKRVDGMKKAERMRRKQSRAKFAYQAAERQRAQKAADLKRKKEEEQRAVERFLERKRREQNARKKKAGEQDEKRRRAKEMAEEKVRAQALKIMEKERAMALHKEEMDRRRAEEAVVRDEVKRLKQQEKWQNIERNKRIQKYKRMSMNKKQEYEQQRLRAIDQFKATMVQQRKMHSESSAQQRKQVIKEFSQLLKSDKFSDPDAAIESMLVLANRQLGETAGLKQRLKHDFGIDLPGKKQEY